MPGSRNSIDRRAQQLRSRQHFETEVAAGKASLDLLKHPLYPYQQEGMLYSGIHRPCPAGGRDGPGQDGAGSRRLRTAAPHPGHPTGAGDLARFAQGRMGGADRQVHRPALIHHPGTTRPAPAPVRRARRSSILPTTNRSARMWRRSMPPWPRMSSSSTRPSASRTGRPRPPSRSSG